VRPPGRDGAGAHRAGPAGRPAGLWFHERGPLTRFVSPDGAQVQAARELGLPL
jgi:hypothetical protein